MAARALDETQDKMCARVSPLMHLTDSLGLLPERLLRGGGGEVGGRADPPGSTTPRSLHVAGAHALHAPPRGLTRKG